MLKTKVFQNLLINAKNGKLKISTQPDFFKVAKSSLFSGDFCIFKQFLAKPHLVAQQNITFQRISKSMSGGEAVYLCAISYMDGY